MGFFDPPWRAEHRLLQTRLTPEECRDRLTPLVGSSWGGWSTCPLRGSVRADGFSVTKTINYRNSFQTEASGRFEANADGTHIRVRLAMSPFVVAFICLWIGILGAMCLTYLVTYGGLLTTGPLAELLDLANGVGGLAGMMVLGFGAQAFGRWVARNEADFLMGFLADTLDAHEVPERQ